MSEPYVGEIRMFAGNFAPRGWAFCDGQLLAVSQNDALFSLLGTIYGGDGRTTFGLPDVRGRVPVHQGTGPGLSQRRLGSKGGSEDVTLTSNQLASHSHDFNANTALADSEMPTGRVVAQGDGVNFYRNRIPKHQHGVQYGQSYWRQPLPRQLDADAVRPFHHCDVWYLPEP